MKKTNGIWRWISLVSLVLTLAVNGYANSAKLNGFTTGEISDLFDVLFVPAGYVFSIWGVIYLFLLAFMIFQFTPAQKENPRFGKIAPWFVLTNIANAAWLVLFHYQQHYFTIVAMLVLLIALIIIYLRLNKSKVQGIEAYLVDLTFSIYLGWVSVATIANATQFLDYVGWSGFGLADEIWLVIVLAVAVLLSWAMNRRFHDLAYSLVLVWAFIGIAVRFPTNQIVAYASYIAAGLVLLLYVLAKKRSESK